MDFQTLINYFTEHGLMLLFVIIFLEHLNLPGLPAGIIMPTAGFLLSQSTFNFLSTLCLSVLAGVLGSCLLYAIGYYLGSPLLSKLTKKNKLVAKEIEKATDFQNKHGNKGVLIARLLPVVRTIVSLTSGTLRMPLRTFLSYSTIGILIYNTAFIAFGYFAGYLFLS
ncbi:MAG TPA: alkaline phosphatase [Firmicutes bacterium]|nr:alkaline phosphatase [Bacillota bacterium]